MGSRANIDLKIKSSSRKIIKNGEILTSVEEPLRKAAHFQVKAIQLIIP